jgi:hypothetical protein
MVEASESLPDIRQSAQAMTLPHWLARKAIKAKWQAQGLRVQYIEAREITIAARTYLEEHPELIDQAAEIVRNHPKLRTLAEREARTRKGIRQ